MTLLLMVPAPSSIGVLWHSSQAWAFGPVTRAGTLRFHWPLPFRSARGTRVERPPSPTLIPPPSITLNTVPNSSSPHSNVSVKSRVATTASQWWMFPV